MQLQPGTTLCSGKYKIERVLGQGGFGITYLAVQSGLNRRVAVKEFFMKEHCNRDAQTCHVSVPSIGSRELVERFRQKFLKEAQTIAAFDLPNIVRIHDIFEENGTAYYVMENIDGGALSDQHLPMSEEKAVFYIRQIGKALAYIHSHNVLHLDVKPSNILLRRNGDAVLIDFGISKRYDDGGSQTSSTPAGISKGYAPIEQYNQGLQTFSPATDIYSLGATLYKLITGETPPEASIIYEDGLPAKPNGVSVSVWKAIESAMQPRRKDRLQTISAFLQLLDNEVAQPVKEETVVVAKVERPAPTTPKPAVSTPKPAVSQQPQPKAKKSRTWIWVTAGIIAVAGIVVATLNIQSSTNSRDKILANLAADMVYVEGGTFTMGATSEQGDDAYDNEKPAHQVTLSSFYICIHEVTQEEWEAVMGSNPLNWKGKRRPVENVSWEDCQTFISKLNSITGKTYRLPTEAEWEYAARGGNRSNGYKYSGSNTLDDVAWYRDNSGKKTHEWMTKWPNELGLYDMSGNVWEWCSDWYDGEYYAISPSNNPKGPSSGSNRVLRGGSWFSGARGCRVSYRGSGTPSGRNNYIGLRLVL